MQIYTIDLNFQEKQNTIASYLIVGSAGPVLVETGPISTLNTLLDRLASYGYGPADIRHVLVTHIHLDTLALLVGGPNKEHKSMSITLGRRI